MVFARESQTDKINEELDVIEAKLPAAELQALIGQLMICSI